MKKILKYFSSDDFIFKSQVSFTIIIFIQILFVFLILVPLCRADSVAMVGFGPVASSCDDCSGDLRLSAHFENNDDLTQGTPCGCADDDDTWTLSSDMVYSTTQKYDGSYSVRRVDVYDRAEIGIASGISTNFKQEFRVYITTFQTNSGLTNLYYDTDNRITTYTTGSSSDIRVGINVKAGGTSNLLEIGAGNGRAENEWFYVQVRGKYGVAGNDLEIKVCDSDGTSNCQTVIADKDFGSFAAEPNICIVGANSATTEAFYLDALKLWGDSGL